MPEHDVKITHPDKLLFPEDGITKAELIDYYRRIAAKILPHVRERALAMERYPDGIGKPGFFQKAAAHYYPEWIRTVTVPKAGGTVKHVVCEGEDTLAYLANQACITPHIWLSRIDSLDYPDQMVFDLDPSTDEFASVKAAGQAIKTILDDLKLPAYLKTTGSRGLHVAVPLDRSDNFDSVRALARALAAKAVEQSPGEFTLEQRKNMRGARVFIDTNRNAYAQTVAPAYAVRPRPGAPVSVPLDWSELDRKALRPDGVTIRTVFDLLQKGRDDPWKDFWRRAKPVAAARRKLAA
jgi:bifunctional non-homologous end joining protein LigD